jgi:hypothetical protein
MIICSFVEKLKGIREKDARRQHALPCKATAHVTNTKLFSVDKIMGRWGREEKPSADVITKAPLITSRGP